MNEDVRHPFNFAAKHAHTVWTQGPISRRNVKHLS